MQLTGIHHLTAITANAQANLGFYTNVLGMRLVKKTVNQDDVSAYHLFYADGRGTPGTDITFFDWRVGPERRGGRSVARTGLRTATSSFGYWIERLREAGAKVAPPAERDGRLCLDFEDPEGQRLTLVADDGDADFHPWAGSPVPAEHQTKGLGPIVMSVARLGPTEDVLTRILGMREARRYEIPSTDGSAGSAEARVFEMGEGGPAAELHVAIEPGLAGARSGAGGVHHVAFRVPSVEEYWRWNERLNELSVRTSGPVDRFYFRSLYFREPGGVLFELATDEPGFDADEPVEHLGERLSLPPFLEGRRSEIEAKLRPL